MDSKARSRAIAKLVENVDQMIRPTKLMSEEVLEVAREMPLDEVLQDVGVVVGQHFADALESVGLRPADYGSNELVAILRERVRKALREESAFAEALSQTLGMRG